MRPFEIVRLVAPAARLEYVTAFSNGDALFQKYGVTTPLRMAHFLAQVLAETGGLTVTWENMSYSAPRILEVFGITPDGVVHHSSPVTAAEAPGLAHNPQKLAERVYGLGSQTMSVGLGNVQPSDGYRYRGGGIMQTTGRYNYRKMGKLCGVDFENHPELILSAAHALKPALAEWNLSNCNAWADQNDILAISRAINLGSAASSRTPNGMNNRHLAFDKVWPVCRDNGVNLMPGAVSLEPLPTSAAPVVKKKTPTAKHATTGAVIIAGGAAAQRAHAAGFGTGIVAGIVVAAAIAALVAWIIWTHFSQDKPALPVAPIAPAPEPPITPMPEQPIKQEPPIA